MLKENYSLLRNNTFGIDVSARYFFEYETVGDLIAFLSSDLAKENRLFHIGGGSNLLFLSDFKGVVIHSKIRSLELLRENENEVLIRAGAGVVWDDLVEYCVEKGFGGIENLSLIPGEVGASPIQNIGAYGAEAKDVIVAVEAIDAKRLTFRSFSNSECQFGYRDSIFKNELKGCYFVTHVVYQLKKKPVFNTSYQNVKSEVEALGEISLKNIRKAIIKIRKEKLPDPLEIGSAGSFFMNPKVDNEMVARLKEKYPDIPVYPFLEGFSKISAGWLIEQCGWRGKSIGAAGVYPKQSLVLINKGGALGSEIATLSEEIRTSVQKKFEIKINTEVIFV